MNDDRAADDAADLAPDPGLPRADEPADLADLADLADPDDPVVAAALARTRADLAAHAARTPPAPAGLLADIGRRLASERAGGTGGSTAIGEDAHPGEPVDRRALEGVPPAAPGARPGRPGRRGRAPGRVVGAALALVATAAAAAVVVAVVVAVTRGPGVVEPAPTAAPPSSAPSSTAPAPDVPVLAGGDGPAALRAGLGRTDYGPLAEASRLTGCLAAHDVPVGVRPIGARQVVVDGREGVLLVLPTGTAARFRLLVVEPGCTTGAPLTVSDTLVGR